MKIFTISEFRKKYASWKKHLWIIIMVTWKVQALCIYIYYFMPEQVPLMTFMFLGLTVSTNLLAVGYIVTGLKKAQDKLARLGL